MHRPLPSRTACTTQTGWSQPWNAEQLKIIQQQAGHEHASTTSIYTNPRELHQMGAFALVA
jgi:hypothetical protein